MLEVLCTMKLGEEYIYYCSIPNEGDLRDSNQNSVHKNKKIGMKGDSYLKEQKFKSGGIILKLTIKYRNKNLLEAFFSIIVLSS